jgi:hypothetical protein
MGIIEASRTGGQAFPSALHKGSFPDELLARDFLRALSDPNVEALGQWTMVAACLKELSSCER